MCIRDRQRGDGLLVVLAGDDSSVGKPGVNAGEFTVIDEKARHIGVFFKTPWIFYKTNIFRPVGRTVFLVDIAMIKAGLHMLPPLFGSVVTAGVDTPGCVRIQGFYQPPVLFRQNLFFRAVSFVQQVRVRDMFSDKITLQRI